MGKGGFSLNFILIFIGLGILRGSSAQRGLLGALMALGMIGAVIVLLAFLIGPAVSEKQEFSLAKVLAVIGIGAVYIYCFYVIGSAKNDPWFKEKSSDNTPEFVVSIAVVISIVFAFGQLISEFHRRSEYEKLFQYDLDIEVVDEKTGAPIERASIGHSGGEFSDLGLPDFLTSKSSSSPGDPKVAMTIQGFARSGFRVTVDADGYEGVIVEVNKHTESPLRVKLRPKKG